MNIKSFLAFSVVACAVTPAFCIAQAPSALKQVPSTGDQELHMDLSDIRPIEIKNLDSEWKPGVAEKGLLRGVPTSWYGTYRCVDSLNRFQFVRLVCGYEILFGKWDNSENQIRWLQHGSAKFNKASSGTGGFDIQLIEAPFESSSSIDYWLGEFKITSHAGGVIRIELKGEMQSFGCFTGANPPKIPLHLVLTKMVEK